MIEAGVPAPPLEWQALGNHWLSTDTRFFIVTHGGWWQAYHRRVPQAIDLGTFAALEQAQCACQAVS